ncbi:MAG TPA: biotin carboxylase [Candidatus Limnocylindria bacterium]|nr:biotin carboxylase [Candidatus Limnocylindria bacterium]
MTQPEGTAAATERQRPAAAGRSSAPAAPTRRVLHGVSDIRRYFHRNEAPVYFISATNFNLLGMDEWVRNFHFINYIDCFDGQHPHVFVPSEVPHRPFTSLEEINNYLLEHKEVVDYIRQRGPGGKAVFLFFDERTEELCDELGLELCFPSASLRSQVDSKVEATRIADRAGVESVPHKLTRVEGWDHLREVSRELGDDLVIQTPYGDSGHTTFFIRSREDFDRHADEIIGEAEVKVMKRVRVRGSALEACVTQHGTIVGPLMTELVGFRELTPYRGGWCGNEVFADAFPRSVREQAREATFRFGEELRRMGYLGYFELDFLTDQDTDRLYLGEVNPRITGASAMTNLAAFAHADAPLFLFHLLDWCDVDFELDVEELNARWADPANIDSWGQLVIKHVRDTTELVTAAPRSGVWRLRSDGSAEFVRTQTHRRTVESESEAFFLRITKAGDYLYEGADLGILITPGRLMTEDHRLDDRALAWTRAILAQYASRPIGPEQTQVAAQVAEVGNFKIM